MIYAPNRPSLIQPVCPFYSSLHSIASGIRQKIIIAILNTIDSKSYSRDEKIAL